MAIEIKVPNLPESVSSATVATWHLKAGDAVKREQNLVDLETDKVMLEVLDSLVRGAPNVPIGVLVIWNQVHLGGDFTHQIDQPLGV